MSAHDDSVVILIPTASDFNFFQTPSTAKSLFYGAHSWEGLLLGTMLRYVTNII